MEFTFSGTVDWSKGVDENGLDFRVDFVAGHYLSFVSGPLSVVSCWW